MADPETESLMSKLMADWKLNQWCTCLGHGPKCHENPRDFFFFFLHSTDFFKNRPGGEYVLQLPCRSAQSSSSAEGRLNSS